MTATKHHFILGLGIFIVLAIIFIAVELLYISKNGVAVEAPAIPRNAQLFGNSGQALTYVVMGDSTSIGQGTDYHDSYAYQSAKHLAQNHKVKLVNIGVSGARASDVVTQQLAKVDSLKPNLVLLAVGANDVTHFTSSRSFEKSVQTIIDGLKRGNCKLKIVVTGSPAMGSVSRFPVGAKQLAGLRTNQLNNVYRRLIAENSLTFAPIAARTGPAFAADPTLFAKDNFHPNARGYALWTPVINQALDAALESTPEACQ